MRDLEIEEASHFLEQSARVSETASYVVRQIDCYFPVPLLLYLVKAHAGRRIQGMKTQRYLATLSINLALVLRLQAASTVQFAQSAPYVVAENGGSVTLSVQRLDELGTTVSVDFATVEGTASAGLKYTVVAGTLIFALGETNKTISVSILNDGIVGGTQDFQVALSNPSGEAVLGTPAAATVRVLDNDKGLQFEFSNYSVAEDAGTVLIGVLRRDDGNFPITVDYATTDGTAKSGVDYTGVTNTLSFATGQTVTLFTVPIHNDSTKEGGKSFRLTLNNPTGGGILGTPRSVTVTILDNDPGVQFEFSNYWASEDEGSLSVNVQRGRDADTEPFTVDYAITAGTALAGQDYVDTQGTLTFAAGESSHKIAIPILRNESSLSDRQFKLTLSNPSAGATLGTNRNATVTVLDTTGMQPHRISGISVQPDHSVMLSFDGSVHKRFKDYFDLYPMEVSKDLVTWVPWTTLQRTNASTNALTYAIPAQTGSDRMFFRTAAGPLITPYRQPTGPFAVGSITRLVTDSSRRNRYGISTNGSFMITVWYPVLPEAGKLPDGHDHPYASENTFRQNPFYAVERVRSLVVNTFHNAPMATNHSKYPVVLHSSGGDTGRTELFGTGPNLASHGYVVVALDPANARVSTFPDGSIRYGPVPFGDIFATFTDANFQDRLRDFSFVLERLAEWNSDDSLFAGHLDLSRLGTMGFSYGGGVAAEFARLDERVKAVALRDSYLQNANDLMRSGLSKPFLGMYSTEGGGDNTLYSKGVARDAIWFLLNPSVHNNFIDYYWLGDSSKSGHEISRTINDWTLWFLNKHVKGLDEPMPALKDYPRITGFKQK